MHIPYFLICYIVDKPFAFDDLQEIIQSSERSCRKLRVSCHKENSNHRAGAEAEKSKCLQKSLSYYTMSLLCRKYRLFLISRIKVKMYGILKDPSYFIIVAPKNKELVILTVQKLNKRYFYCLLSISYQKLISPCQKSQF